MYKNNGGQSINLTQFWKAVGEGKAYEQAAYETFTGKWAKKNGFTKVVIENVDKDVTKSFVKLKFVR